jgi:hypothetical protein
MKEPVGRVYVLTNPRMQGLVKIGFTLGTVEGRAKELDATGTPEPFEIAYQVEVRGPETLERHAHVQLTEKRVRNSREFFEVDVVEAILCIRSLASERLDEECSPRYIEMVDETAKRRAEEREINRVAEKAQRFEIFDHEAKKLQDKKNQLARELEDLLVKANSGPPLLQLNWLEARGEVPLLMLGLLFLILCIAAITPQYFLLSGSLALIAFTLLITSRRIKSISQNKKTHNLQIERREREIFNLKFDLKKLESQKIHLPRDLAEFVPVNPIRADERGFEPAAQVDSRRRS